MRVRAGERTLRRVVAGCVLWWAAAWMSVAFAERPMVALPERSGDARWPRTPLPPHVEQRLRSLPEDPGLQRPPVHFVISDERRHDVFRPFLQGRGGVFVGVGTDQNYLMAGWARPELLVIADYDPVVVALHHVYRLAFLHAETPEGFRELWEEEHLPRMHDWIDAEASDAAQARAWHRALRISAVLVRGKLRRTVRALSERGVPCFLTDEEQYRGLRALFRLGRVLPIRADFTGSRRLHALWEVLRDAGLTVRVFYASNVERYFDYEVGRFRANLREVPGDDASLFLRTVGWGHRWPSPEGDGRYLYVVQPLRNLQRWLAHPRVRTYKPMVRRRRPTPLQGLYFTSEEPPPVRHLRARRPARR